MVVVVVLRLVDSGQQDTLPHTQNICRHNTHTPTYTVNRVGTKKRHQKLLATAAAGDVEVESADDGQWPKLS